MNVASLDLCKRLYEVSGWSYPGSKRWVIRPIKFHGQDSYEKWTLVPAGYRGRTAVTYYPAYDLGFLFRKLQPHDPVLKTHAGFRWMGMCNPDYYIYTDVPEDALASLAIELFRRGILSHE